MHGFAWALAAFVLIHVGISATGLRGALVGRIGEGPYRIAFSIVSLALLLWLIHAFGVMRADESDPLNGALWTPPAGLRWPAYVLVLTGLALVVAGFFSPGPTLAGYEKKGLAMASPARGALRITRHPFLWGVALWAAGHLLVNGERFALMLFGALGLMVLFGARSIDRKGRARDAEAWAKFEGVTSNVPFAAIVQGRNQLRLSELAVPLLVGVAVAFAIGLFHQQLFGVPAFSTSP